MVVPGKEMHRDLYHVSHPNAKYCTLNSLNVDLMRRSPGMKGDLCRHAMLGVLQDVFEFNETKKKRTKCGQ